MFTVITVKCRHRGIAEKCRDLIKLLLRNGIKFMIVALGTGHRKPLPDTKGGAGPVGGIHRKDLLSDRAPLTRRWQATVEAGSYFLVQSRRGQ